MIIITINYYRFTSHLLITPHPFFQLSFNTFATNRILLNVQAGRKLYVHLQLLLGSYRCNKNKRSQSLNICDKIFYPSDRNIKLVDLKGFTVV